MTTAHAARLRDCLVAELTAEGDLTADWRETFLAVSRHLFIPDTVWRQDPAIDGPNDLVPVHRRESPEEWLEITYANRAVTVQVDDGYPVGPDGRGRDISSSASHPGVVAQMLAASGAQPGERLLEIGTGTGYNTALLAHRLGARNIVSVEIDETLADHAQRALATAGYDAVTVLTGDGALGHPGREPYDRVVCTASVRRVPHAWVSQTRPGGRILTPWANAYFDGGLLALEPLGDGTATGRIVGKAWFMWLRDQRVPRVSVSRFVRADQHAEVSTTEVHPFEVAGDYDAQLAVSLRVPECRHLYWRPDHDDDHGTLWLIDPGSGAWASLRHHPSSDGPYDVRQHGPRRLWDEAAAAYRWWRDAGAPTAADWIFTVTPDTQRVRVSTTAG
ncbi:MAG: methyltransferase domain-containing protein [Pseudonocardiaceae bacterium]